VLLEFIDPTNNMIQVCITDRHVNLLLNRAILVLVIPVITLFFIAIHNGKLIPEQFSIKCNYLSINNTDLEIL